jgi:hypothetical protein
MSAIRGEAAELLCASVVLEAGWQWCWPVAGRHYDGLVCFDEADPNTYWRVQVKRIFMWTQKRGKTPAVNVRRGDDTRYDKNDADYLAAVDMEAGLVYLIPWEEVYRKKRLTINHEKHQEYLVMQPEESGD